MLQALRSAVTAVRDFLDLGGDVVLPILGATFLMWVLILERCAYYYLGHPREVKRAITRWHERSDRSSWYAHQVRELLISEVRERLGTSLSIVRALISVCLLLGLLGTVMGMIEVFEVMSILGSGNPRAMASGVYKAMIPTMCGMVAALSGYFFSARMDRFARQEGERVADALTRD